MRKILKVFFLIFIVIPSVFAKGSEENQKNFKYGVFIMIHMSSFEKVRDVYSAWSEGKFKKFEGENDIEQKRYSIQIFDSNNKLIKEHKFGMALGHSLGAGANASSSDLEVAEGSYISTNFTFGISSKPNSFKIFKEQKLIYESKLIFKKRNELYQM